MSETSARFAEWIQGLTSDMIAAGWSEWEPLIDHDASFKARKFSGSEHCLVFRDRSVADFWCEKWGAVSPQNYAPRLPVPASPRKPIRQPIFHTVRSVEEIDADIPNRD